MGCASLPASWMDNNDSLLGLILTWPQQALRSRQKELHPGAEHGVIVCLFKTLYSAADFDEVQKLRWQNGRIQGVTKVGI